MKYFVDVLGKSYELDIETTPDGRFIVRADGRAHTIDYLATTRHEASLLIDGRASTFWFHEGARGSMHVSDGRDSFHVRCMDERTKLEEAILGRKVGGAGPREVRSIMPGIVTRLLVQEGATVEPGTPLLCIEAMKMENEIKAETGGTVKKILVAAGKTVNAGELLVELAG